MQINTRTATQARIEFFDLINAAKYSGQVTHILKNGKLAAKITPIKPKKKFNWAEFKTAMENAVGIFDDEDVKQIKQVRIDSYKNKYPEW